MTPHDDASHFQKSPELIDEGGLRAPPNLSFWGKAWWWFHFVILLKLARLRFIGLLVLIGLIIVKWDTLIAYYDRWTRPTTDTAVAQLDVEYFCPMHPTVIRDNPREKCPICFMPLSKRKKGEATDEALPPGIANRVQLSPYRVVQAGIQTTPVESLPLHKEIVTVGTVEFNERGLKHIAARVKGRIDALYISETGRTVEAGDELASIYSPDLVITMQNLLEAKKASNQSLLRDTVERLRLWGISDDQIQKILTTGTANTHLKIRTPIKGHVIKKYVREGQYVDEGSPLYDVADLSTVWVQAQIYEDDVPFLGLQPHQHDRSAKEGPKIPVIATARTAPGESFKGELSFVFPHIDQDTRTLTIRFELSNPDHKLRPGTTCSVKIRPPLALVSSLAKALDDKDRVIAVPESVVIDTGSQQIVYREVIPGQYEGVKVSLGSRLEDDNGAVFYPVLSGLVVGDRVVTSGSFLLDAETRLNPAAGSIYFGGSGGKTGSGQTGGTTQVRPSTPEDEALKIKSSLSRLSPGDRKLAETQRFCPILTDRPLGTMGPPLKLTLDGETVFLCCGACENRARANPVAAADKVRSFRNRFGGATPKENPLKDQTK
jgi:Cu(I)/Ag(I) efflux system membrane fusion protein